MLLKPCQFQSSYARSSRFLVTIIHKVYICNFETNDTLYINLDTACVCISLLFPTTSYKEKWKKAIWPHETSAWIVVAKYFYQGMAAMLYFNE